LKIAIPVKTGEGLNAQLDNRFGRAAYFLFFDTQNQEWSCIANEFKDEAQGVGPKASGLVVEKGCNMVIGARPGPKAISVLEQAHITVIVAGELSATEAIERYAKI